ncbi:helix-turn-helix domain-containing protein [bacterium]|nr:helix-turn-helix domain-containing protein [bacterium]
MVTDKWLTIDELAKYLKLGQTKLYHLAQNGEIPASKVGSQWRFDREEIDIWVKSQRNDGNISRHNKTGNAGEES